MSPSGRRAAGTPTAPEHVAPEERAAAAFGRLVAVMDRLRSPGGCRWDAEQTHASLVPYALEEVHELAEAVDAGDREGLREELGDVLLQVVFHARVAQDDAQDPFDVAEVADRLVAKLVRRHPHVFREDGPGTDGSGEDGPRTDGPGGDAPGADGPGAADLHRRWDDAKRAEKPARASALDGVPASLGSLARTQKVAGKAVRAGLLDLEAPAPDDRADLTAPAPASAEDLASAPRAAAVDGIGDDAVAATGRPADDEPLDPADTPDVEAAVSAVTGGVPDVEAAVGAVVGAAPDPDERDSALGARLLALVLEAEREGVDAEGALRRAAAAWEVGLRAAERGDTGAGPTPWR
ncbi:MazG nucleotide pyrophosphohydrolase domain-containing protein [Cellulomonas telluris]|uniref:MazG nucleotide pyrophosphohydrolase domain-containing protein n=1 Tax=Cellulomonas telluris TaxID=2306636 RepID=UPI001FE27522|nr:MazG nucleotide pyrophosphohydrolase domain-containing protein [Cellulomonas telluris]